MKNKNTIKAGSFVYIKEEGLDSLYTVEKINKRSGEARIYHPLLNTKFVDIKDLDLVPETF
jgi:hypothetical protein